MASEYFGHFCMLMHLEHMEELRQIRPTFERVFQLESVGHGFRVSVRGSRRRTETMADGELQRLGWCLDGLPCSLAC